MLETWPLFMNFRSSEQYKRFKNAHAEDFKVATFEINAESNLEDNSDTDVLGIEGCENQFEEENIDPALEPIC